MVHIKQSPILNITQTNTIADQMKRYVCKVFSNYNDHELGTGFFCNLCFNNIKIPSLITACYITDVNKLLSNGIIKIRTNEEEKVIQIDENRTLYSNEEYNITIIEVKPEDKIDHFLDIDEGIFREINDYKNMSIYCIQYLKGMGVNVSYGILKDIEEYEIKHLCSTERGSGGSPIFNLETNKVIGIHFGYSKEERINLGNFLTKPVIEFMREIEYKKYNEYKSKAFSNLKLIASGSYGKIYSAFDTIIKNEICLKKINLEEMKLNYEENKLTTDYLKDLSNEIKILKLLSSDYNSVKFYGTYEENNEKVIIMEKCDKNLKQFIKERGKEWK